MVRWSNLRGKSLSSFIIYILMIPLVFANGVYELQGTQSITVRLDNGQEVILREGALISIDPRSEGWAYSLTVLRTHKSASIQSPQPAKLGKQTFNDYVHRQLLTRRESATPTQTSAPVTPQRQKYTIDKRGEVQFVSDQGTFYLNEGDSFELVTTPGSSWRQEVVIVDSTDRSKIGQRAGIGKVFLNGLIDSGHVVSSHQTRPPSVQAPARTNTPATQTAAPVQTLELSSQSLCPAAGSYKVEKSFFYNTQEGVEIANAPMTISAGTIVQVSPSQDEVRCQFKVLSSVDGDRSLLGVDLLTYPSNFQGRNLVPHSNDGQAATARMGLEVGTRFMMTSPDVIDLYHTQNGARASAIVGAPYDIVGEQRGQFIIRAENGQRFRVDKESLLDARDQNDLFFDSQGSFAQTLEQVIAPLPAQVQRPCPDLPLSPLALNRDPILWESCRDRPRAASNGRTLPANNYYDNLIKGIQQFGSAQSAQVLADPQGRELSECVMNSLKGGGNNNAHPDCRRNARGELQLSPIRQTVRRTNSQGRSYSSIQILNPAPKACASELTSTYLTHHFMKAMSCLDLDPKEVFPLINHESHFQPGAVSPTGALSVGQTVVSNYLEIHSNLERAQLIVREGGNRLTQQRRFNDPEVYRTQYENSRSKSETRMTTILVAQLEEQIRNPTAKGCEALKNMMERPFRSPAGRNPVQHVIDTENRRLCPPDQPQEAFLMAGIDYLANKKYAHSLIGDWEAKLPAQQRMSAAQKEELAIVLARWMYNGGQTGIAGSFEFFMEELTAGRVTQRDHNLNPVSRSGQRQLVSARNLKNLGMEDFKKYMSVHIMQSYSGSQARKAEVAGYIQKMDRDLKVIEDRGLSCGN